MAPITRDGTTAARYVVSGRLFVRVPADNQACIYRPSSGATVSYMSYSLEDPAHLERNYSCVAVSADGDTVVFGTTDGSVVIWDVDIGKVSRSFKATLGGTAVTDVAISGGWCIQHRSQM